MDSTRSCGTVCYINAHLNMRSAGAVPRNKGTLERKIDFNQIKVQPIA